MFLFLRFCSICVAFALPSIAVQADSSATANFSATKTLEITDSFGKHQFEKVPKRVVVLNWTVLEQLLVLDVKPVGVADVVGYKKWFSNLPPIPQGIADVGSREAPHLDKIVALKPDVIIVGQSQRDLIRRLQNIAPVLYFKNFSRRYNHLEQSSKHLLTLATLFEKQNLAQQRLKERDAKIAALKKSLNEKYKVPPKVLLLRAEGQSCCWFYGENAMPQYALELLGLKTALPLEASKFGVTKMDISELPPMSGAHVLLFDGASSGTRVPSSKDWLALTKNNPFKLVDSVSSFGGAMSILYLAEAISAALLNDPVPAASVKK